ncbi:MAG: malonic semialdehyde reductase [Sphingorhabdus sp.]
MPVNAPLDDIALDRLFREGRTYNGYLDQPVTNAHLEAIWELMKYGPTSANCLPARIIWCVSDESKGKLAGLSMQSNADKIRKAPATAILGMDMEFYELLPELFPHTDAKSWFIGNQEMIEKTAFRNSSLQGGYFILAARALGLDTGAMSGFDNAAVDKAFFAGTKVKSNFISTIGYGDPATIFDRSPRPEFDRFNKIV